MGFSIVRFDYQAMLELPSVGRATSGFPRSFFIHCHQGDHGIILYSMAFTIKDPLLSKIETNYHFINSLITEFPHFLSNWEKETDEKFQEEAEKAADGDSDVYQSILSNLRRAFDDNSEKESVFNKAMVVITYAFYENILNEILQTDRVDKVDAICAVNNISLSDEAIAAKDFIANKIRELRNHIVHKEYSNANRKIKTDICREYPEITVEDGGIYINGGKFTQDSLEKEFKVLYELAEKLGHHHSSTSSTNNNEANQ